MNKEPCIHEYLARTEFAEVVTCRKCGVVHLRLQNLSLQFSTEAFAGLVDTLNAAAGKITPAPILQIQRPRLKIVK